MELVALVAADSNGLNSKTVLRTLQLHSIQLRRPFFKRSAHKLDNGS